jgi:hypothetical protein
VADNASNWPPLPLDGWRDTYSTLHMWMQMVGKVRLACAPPVNHWWHVALYVTARGLTTSPMPWRDRVFEIEFDFVHHNLVVTTDGDSTRSLPLIPRSVADFHRELLAVLHALGIEVAIWDHPAEVPDAIPFSQDETHRSYDAGAAHRFWQVLVQADRALHAFRGRFLGKASPVHVFWGGCDIALTYFSGRRAPEQPGANLMNREAYSHEVASFGFWPGGITPNRVRLDEPMFYAYAVPQPPGYAETAVRPGAAYYHKELGEFVLPYEAVRRSPSPELALSEFFTSTYVAAATLGHWDRAALER